MAGRGDKWRATRRVREAALFADKRFEVVREVKNEEFVSPLGYKGKNGYEVRNIDTDETFMVGKATLKQMANEWGAVELPAPKKRGRPKKAVGGVVPGTAGSDEIPAHLVTGDYVIRAGKTRAYDDETVPEANQPGAHPVSTPDNDDDRSGSLAGPTYDNPNEDEHYEG